MNKEQLTEDKFLEITKVEIDGKVYCDSEATATALLEALEGEKYTKENEYFDMWSEHQGGYNQALDKAKQIISEYFGV